ncbi:MAG: glycosyltransferase [Kiritimatiellae bacterium]|nr:glycosyltransferase [Kiritimatiellia bacterium]
MNIALAIVTLNAVKQGYWEECLAAIDAQTLRPSHLLCADSESSDNTVALALAHGWEHLPIQRNTFNHGKTRDAIARLLAQRGADILILMTQDVVLATPDSLKILVERLQATHATAAYGRQCSRNSKRTLDNWQRAQSYPEESCIKTQADIPTMGLLTVFCSDAFCAWDLNHLLAQGGFPEASFGEDMLAAAQAIEAGSAIAYCAEACCWHDHSVSYRDLFARGKAIGRMHAQHADLLKRYGSATRKGLGLLKHGLPQPSILLQLFVKAAGYFYGKHL